MISEKLDVLMTALNAGNGDIAKLAGFDRSNVSRIRSGSRVPRIGGASVSRLAQALVDFAVRYGRTEVLCDTIMCSRDIQGAALVSAASEWLCQNESEYAKMPERSAETSNTAAVFGRKLSRITELAGISNVNLSKAVNIDPSYLSRMKTGKRLPGENSRVLEGICSVLLKKITDKQHMAELAGIMGESASGFITSPEKLASWLMNASDETYKVSVSQLISHISAIGSFTLPAAVPEKAAVAITENETIYHGTDGLRRAVTRFLQSTRENSRLCLYSDQSMDWMTGSFNAAWKRLLAASLGRGVRIRIIHDIERSPVEMLEAVTSWLPLYMTGLIEPYYCTIPRGNRFGYTMFLDPGNACIEGICVRGMEEICDYHYITDDEGLNVRRKEFSQLIGSSRRLIEIAPGIVPDMPGAVCRTVDGVRLMITEKLVVIVKLSAPSFTFRFEHPLLIEPFRSLYT